MLVTEQERLKKDIELLVGVHGRNRNALIPILQEIQTKYHYISEYAMQVIADMLGIHPVEVYGVVSFYSFLDQKYRGRFVIRLCRTISCDMQGKDRVARQLENDLGIAFGESTPDGKFTLEYVNCLGMCDQGPALLVNDQIFTRVVPTKVHEILEGCRKAFGVYRDYQIRATPLIKGSKNELTFGKIPPEAGLKVALTKSRADVIAEIAASGLKGRGGAGFPTSVKWNLAAAAKGDQKYVVCNADEGEPGTFKDRVIVTDYADKVIEGMTIGGRVIGAAWGIIYLRGEYAYLRPHLESVVANRRAKGLLGKNVAGTDGFDFDVQIRMGAGAYVCGEETALIESLEGQRGEPRNRPPFPVDTGYMGCPTIVNNVETFAWVPCILAKGAAWFKAIGTDKSTGLKIFSVSGDCERPGVYEFPMGITVAQLLKTVGGTNAKAVQIGGASGHCVPAAEFDRTIAFEDVPTGGSVIVLGPHRDMLAVAKNFLEFFVEESCGQCTPCREGNPKLLEGVEMLEAGRCSTAYLNDLCALGETMQCASKCGLGQSSPNAFLSIVKHFRNEIIGRTADYQVRSE